MSPSNSPVVTLGANHSVFATFFLAVKKFSPIAFGQLPEVFTITKFSLSVQLANSAMLYLTTKA